MFKCIFDCTKKENPDYSGIIEDFPDIKEYEINPLVRWKPGQYVVYIDPEREFDWETTKEYDTEIEKINLQQTEGTTDRFTIIAEANFLQRRPTVKFLNKRKQCEFAYMLGEVVVLALEENLDESLACLLKTKEYLKKRNEEISRKWQLCFSWRLHHFYSDAHLWFLSAL